MPTRRRETENPIGNDINMGQDRDYEGRTNFNNRTDDTDERGNKEVTDEANLDLNKQNSEERDEMLDKEEEEEEIEDDDDDTDDMTMDDDDDDDDDFDDDDDDDDEIII